MTELFRQIPKFLAVGGGATAVHVAAALAFNGLAGVTPLWANVLAFLVASGVSYLGNWFWTFDAASRHGLAAPRFLALSLTCFAVNQAIVYAVVEWLGRPLWLAMIPVVLVVPAFGFWLSRSWVFLPARQAG
ncbi:MAG TPA: GtrA family protein [Kiloniellales bacterium]|nr:GtrA family protein [Aestuariivirga sp.]